MYMYISMYMYIYMYVGTYGSYLGLLHCLALFLLQQTIVYHLLLLHQIHVMLMGFELWYNEISEVNQELDEIIYHQRTLGDVYTGVTVKIKVEKRRYVYTITWRYFFAS